MLSSASHSLSPSKPLPSTPTKKTEEVRKLINIQDNGTPTTLSPVKIEINKIEARIKKNLEDKIAIKNREETKLNRLKKQKMDLEKRTDLTRDESEQISKILVEMKDTEAKYLQAELEIESLRKELAKLTAPHSSREATEHGSERKNTRNENEGITNIAFRRTASLPASSETTSLLPTILSSDDTRDESKDSHSQKPFEYSYMREFLLDLSIRKENQTEAVELLKNSQNAIPDILTFVLKEKSYEATVKWNSYTILIDEKNNGKLKKLWLLDHLHKPVFPDETDEAKNQFQVKYKMGFDIKDTLTYNGKTYQIGVATIKSLKQGKKTYTLEHSERVQVLDVWPA